MADYQQVIHEFQPVFNRHSRILILGTFPSVTSREQHFYYGHPQNRFWKVLAAVTSEAAPVSIPEKKEFLLSHSIAVWDVIQSCEIIGSSDSSIRNVLPSDIRMLLATSQLSAIFGNGSKACDLYNRYTLPLTGLPIHKLPSTSPANASWSLERLAENWKAQLEPLISQ